MASKTSNDSRIPQVEDSTDETKLALHAIDDLINQHLQTLALAMPRWSTHSSEPDSEAPYRDSVDNFRCKVHEVYEHLDEPENAESLSVDQHTNLQRLYDDLSLTFSEVAVHISQGSVADAVYARFIKQLGELGGQLDHYMGLPPAFCAAQGRRPRTPPAVSRLSIDKRYRRAIKVRRRTLSTVSQLSPRRMPIRTRHSISVSSRSVSRSVLDRGA